MKTAFLLALTATLMTTIACSGTDPDAARSQSPISGSAAQCADDDEEEANDKIYCAVDTDCDSDEVCIDGKCAGLDGDVEDECDDDADDGDDDAADTDDADDADDAADEEEEDGADKIVCQVDTDCDSDEVCTAGLCTGLPEPCASDADCDADEACNNGFCEER